MATSKSNQFEEYVKGLLECPSCSEPINSSPVNQCTNGHVVCKNCIPKLENCPICRNKSKLARNLIFEQIVENFSALELTNEGPSEKPKHQKWGQESVGVLITFNELNKEPSVKLNLQPNSDTIESAEYGVSKFEENIKTLLECPICIEPITSAPIHQCTNGHVVCKDCITKFGKCPICRNSSKLARNLIFEQIVENFTALELAIEGPSEKSKLKKWGLGSVRVFFRALYLNMRPDRPGLSVLKQAAIWFYKFFLFIFVLIPLCATLLCLLLGVFLCIIIVAIFLILSCYNLLLIILAQVGVDTPEEYYSQFGFNAAHIEIFTGSKG